jgi:hypothetical protein
MQGQVRTENCSLGGAGAAEPEAVYNLCLIFKNYITKIMSYI